MQDSFKILTVLGLVMVISSCATITRETTKHDSDYLKQARSVQPTQVPPGLSPVGSQDYYPIPPITLGPVKNVVAMPSSVSPPGNGVALQTQHNNPHPAQPAPSMVVASSSSSLVLSGNYNQAWDKVGRGLRASGYKILQQDKSVGGFFIVNVAETGGQLTANSPIYQVHLTPANTSTTVTILNDKNQPASQEVSSHVLGALKSKL